MCYTVHASVLKVMEDEAEHIQAKEQELLADKQVVDGQRENLKEDIK